MAEATISTIGFRKTLSGSLTMLVASFLVTLVLLATTGQPQVLIPAITLALLATVLEAITPLGWRPNRAPGQCRGLLFYICHIGEAEWKI